MKYDFTIQPMPVRIPGIEAANDNEAREKLQGIMDNQTESIMAALRQSRWTVTLVQQSETYISSSTYDLGVAATEQSEAKLDDEKKDDVLEQDLFA